MTAKVDTCPTSPLVPIPDPTALLSIWKIEVEIGPKIALAKVGGSHIQGFLIIFGICNIEVPIPCEMKPPIPFSR